VSSVLTKTRYPDFTLYIIDNGSCDPVTLAQLEVYARDPRCQIIRDPRPFNFSALNNHAIAHTGAALVCLLNDDVEVITPEWLADMAAAALQPDIGAVGARLWYPDGCLQHGGVILGYGGGAGHALKFHRRLAASHLDPSALIREFSAVTAACLVVRRAHFDAVGGLDEVNFPVNFNDVDFCLKLRELGYRNLYVPTAELWHHESASRGPDHIPARQARFANEVATLQERWAAWIANDPAYNPNLSIQREDCSLAWPPRRPVLEKSRR
jgi:GT2 family glycosyltransferase